MRHVLCLLMLAMYVAAWECTANPIPEINQQMAEIAEETTEPSQESQGTSTDATTEPSQESQDTSRDSTTEPSQESQGTATGATTEPSNEAEGTWTDATTESSTLFGTTTKTGKLASKAGIEVRSASGSTTLILGDSKTIKKKVVNAVKSVEDMDNSSIGSATRFALAAVVTLGMMAVGPAW